MHIYSLSIKMHSRDNMFSCYFSSAWLKVPFLKKVDFWVSFPTRSKLMLWDGVSWQLDSKSTFLTNRSIPCNFYRPIDKKRDTEPTRALDECKIYVKISVCEHQSRTGLHFEWWQAEKKNSIANLEVVQCKNIGLYTNIVLQKVKHTQHTLWVMISCFHSRSLWSLFW